MTQKDIDTPSAMRIRKGNQDAITYSLRDKKFDSSKIQVVEIDITIDNLGWNFNNLRILNLTDIHLGQWINPEYLDKLIDYVNTLNVDLVTLTGDYFSYVTKGYEQSLQDSFKKIESKYGKFGVLGNHDHWMGSKKVRDIFTNSNVIDLSNDVYTLEKDGEFLNICGVDSCTVCADNLDKVLAKMKKDTPSILLAHEPDFAKQSSQTNRFDLQISGHSHGGQFIIPKFETTPFRGPNSRKYPVGIYEVGNMIQYTSKGLGTNSFRLRVNCKPEITIITLKTNKKQEILIK